MSGETVNLNIDDKDFTKRVLYDKKYLKIPSDSVSKDYMDMMEWILTKANYSGYDDDLKNDMKSYALEVFLRYFTRFSLYRTEIKDVLENSLVVQKLNLKRNKFRQLILLCDHYLDEPDILEQKLENSFKLKCIMNELKTIPLTKEEKGAYSYFMRMIENAFVHVIKKYYENKNNLEAMVYEPDQNSSLIDNFFKD